MLRVALSSGGKSRGPGSDRQRTPMTFLCPVRARSVVWLLAMRGRKASARGESSYQSGWAADGWSAAMNRGVPGLLVLRAWGR